jgi:hypothetical protein
VRAVTTTPKFAVLTGTVTRYTCSGPARIGVTGPSGRTSGYRYAETRDCLPLVFPL